MALKSNGKRTKVAKPAPITGPHDSNAHFAELNKIIKNWGK